MNRLKIILSLFASFACLAVLPLRAALSPEQHDAISNAGTTEESGSFLGGIKLSLDTSTAYVVDRGSFDQILQRGFAHGDFGTEIGLNVHAGEHVFLRLDSIIPELEHARGPFVTRSAVSGGVIFRTPIRLDPFAAAGVGYNWRSSALNTHLEAGAELRFTDNVYARAAYRHIFESHKDGGRDSAQITAGIGYRF